ncbi:MAG TPA: tRNA lysidine(34) synthetase TilS [Frankiaceae bacterium]|nr:tRNA lysidine(34) synthetase TilS [Frankiaceae bacterium]
MAGPDPAVADVRRAVRRVLAETPDGALVLAAVSGGADSLALLAALAWEAPRNARRARCVTVDHGLRPGSAEQARRVAAVAAGLGIETDVLNVTVAGADEDAARRARYAALDEAAARLGAAAVLLGHTRDDQAEQVLLGLARGSGARSLGGIPPRRGVYARPLLDLPRATTERACRALGLDPWSDPANDDLRHARNRVRHVALPALEDALGPGIAGALARTARLLRADADLLDELAAKAYAETGLDARRLAALPPALRTRVLLAAAREAGATDLNAGHVAAVEALVTAWHGQGPVALPGGFAVARRCDTLAFSRQ